LQTVSIDGSVLIFTVAAALATGVLFGVAPALQVSRWDVQETLKEASRGTSEGRRTAWVRNTLVVSEVAVACILLVGAALLVRSFLRLLEVDPGFRPEHTSSWRIELGGKYETNAQRDALYEELTRRVAAIPGVESVGLTDALPMGRNRSWGVAAKGVTYTRETYPEAFPRMIDPGYIRAMRIPLRAGREFSEHDRNDSRKVMIVNETMARRLWPDREAVNQIAVISREEWQVIGVVGDVRHSALEQAPGLEMYLPMAQSHDWSSMDLVVRSSMPLQSLVPGVRAALRGLDPDLPNSDFQPLQELVDQAISPRRFVTVLLGGFSLLALILACLGIYGVISYSVTQRTNELGIRLALGASLIAILKLIITQGVKLVLVGLLVGLVAAVVLTRVLSSLVFGVSTTDPLTFLSIAVLLMLVAMFACYIPARRATKVDPVIALRYE
jgi:predicted permease